MKTFFLQTSKTLEEFRRQRGRKLTSSVEIFGESLSYENITRLPFHMSQHHRSTVCQYSQLICVDRYHSCIRSSSLAGSLPSTGGRRRTGSGGTCPPPVLRLTHPLPQLLLSNLSSAHHSSSLSTVSTGFFAIPLPGWNSAFSKTTSPWNLVSLCGRIQWALIYAHMTLHSAILKTLLPHADPGILAKRLLGLLPRGKIHILTTNKPSFACLIISRISLFLGNFQKYLQP